MQGVAEYIQEQYTDLRSKEGANGHCSLLITPRTLKTIIRISSAHAKCRLSQKVEESDVKMAMQVLRFALDNDTKVRTEMYIDDEDGDEQEEGDDDDDHSGDEDGGGKGGAITQPRSKRKAQGDAKGADGDSEEEMREGINLTGMP
jgi:DNA replication licensing factor MCM3